MQVKFLPSADQDFETISKFSQFIYYGDEVQAMVFVQRLKNEIEYLLSNPFFPAQGTHRIRINSIPYVTVLLSHGFMAVFDQENKNTRRVIRIWNGASGALPRLF